jgi:hypothetical protein
MQEIVYSDPSLLKLPKLYSDLFSYYSQRKCSFCSQKPKESAICLICGEHLCYFDCEQMHSLIFEHKNNCGNGTMLLMNINSSYINIIHDFRFSAFPSLYLDEHGEEDACLKYLIISFIKY